MGRILWRRGDFGIPNICYTRCLNCRRSILATDIIPHTKKCSKLFIENFNNSQFAKRFHLIHFTLCLDEKLAKNLKMNQEVRLLLLKLYENIFDIR